MAQQARARREADRIIRAIRRGETVHGYITRNGWAYPSVRSRLVAAGEWTRVMAAKYTTETVGGSDGA